MRLWLGLGFAAAVLASAQPSRGATDHPTNAVAVVLEIEGRAEVNRFRSPDWDPAHTNQVLRPGDGFRTLRDSRALLRVSDRSLLRLGESNRIVLPGPTTRGGAFHLLRGVLYYFHRDKPGEFPLSTPSAFALTRGTEFNVAVDDTGATRLDLIDGEVEMTNQAGALRLKSGEAGLAQPGQAPIRTPMIEAVNVIQWVLYYPGVLDVAELELDPEEQSVLAASLAAYREGDLLAALARYPEERQPRSDRERVYLSALRLAVGQVEQAEVLLASQTPSQGADSRVAELAAALRKLVAAVKFKIDPATLNRRLATCLLAESYYQQSRADLAAALAAARQAAAQSPRSGFAWARVAELEFSFGRIGQARDAVEKAAQLTPRHAQAATLKGFLLAARSRYAHAMAAFRQAIVLDGAQANAWLGLGLCRIHSGDVRGGLADLEAAAALEPQRAILRSYLGKAFTLAKDDPRAERELQLAMSLDPQDPTAWLYAALLHQRQNRINEAVHDLELSQELNDNRRVYRSQLLLDQDRAARGASQANIYRDAGLTDLSVREATRAVSADEANYSAHLFLAESYNALRDPRQINLRYETPWMSEYLLANLLAPAAAGVLTPAITQQEYSRFFDRNRLGLNSSTEYSSRGDWFQSAVQYGTYGRSSYAVDTTYLSENGFRPNNDLEQLTVSLKLKQEISPRDSLFLNAWWYEAESGDLNQYYDQSHANPGLRTKETQEPMLLAGYHHEWASGVHTLFLGGRLQDEFQVWNPRQATLLLGKNEAGFVTDVLPIMIQQRYRSELEMYTAELQQIVQAGRHSLTVGARGQAGEVDTVNQHTNASFFPFLFPQKPQHVTRDLQRASVYGYYRWQVVDPLLLVAGLSYDWLSFPENFRYAPLSTEETETDQLSPKGGLIWTPTGRTTLRGGYAQALSGVSFDQSFQLEPTHVAGFNQAFRSIIPEAVVGANAGAPFETWGASFEQRIGRATYLAVSGQWLNSEFTRTVGAYDYLHPFTVAPSDTREHLDYSERTLTATLNQLVGSEWSFGARYRLSQADLRNDFVDLPDQAVIEGSFRPRSHRESVLHQVNLSALYQHRSGFFGMAEALWTAQSNAGYSPAEPGDDFWQFNLYVGYRFPRRQAELRVGLLNLTGRDYQLEPLNLTADLPRERTVVVRFQFNF